MGQTGQRTLALLLALAAGLSGCSQGPDLAPQTDAAISADTAADAVEDSAADSGPTADTLVDSTTSDLADTSDVLGPEVDAALDGGSDAAPLPEDATTADTPGWWESLEQQKPQPVAVVGQVPCLDYDGVADGTTDDYVLPTEAFKSHMVWLYTHGYTVLTMQQYLALIDAPDFAQKGLPARPVLLFADVSAQTFVKNAWPILYPLGYRITLGIETDLIGEPWAMTVAQLKGLEKLGVEIASHSHSHPDLTTLTPQQLQAEVAGSRQKLQAYGFGVPHFIHPYGMRNLAVDKAIQDAGYLAARSTGAPTIAGGGYSSLDPKRRWALGCALPVQKTSLADLQAYLENPRIELEDVTAILADVGPQGTIERSDFVHDHYLTTTLPDAGDSVRIRLLVNEPGTYDLTFHVKVGFPGVPDGSNDSYNYAVNGNPVAKQLLPGTQDEPPYIVWGQHRLAKQQLPAGLTDIVITSSGDWDVVLDWLEVTK